MLIIIGDIVILQTRVADFLRTGDFVRITNIYKDENESYSRCDIKGLYSGETYTGIPEMFLLERRDKK